LGLFLITGLGFVPFGPQSPDGDADRLV